MLQIFYKNLTFIELTDSTDSSEIVDGLILLQLILVIFLTVHKGGFFVSIPHWDS